MGRTIKIPVSPPLTTHQGLVNYITVREPTYDEYQDHGDPYIWVPIKGGSAYPSENEQVIKAYAAILVVDVDALILRHGGFRLARSIKEAILSFFLPDAAESEDSQTSQTNSPSAATGTIPARASDGSKSPG
jgi:hypothetical protein